MSRNGNAPQGWRWATVGEVGEVRLGRQRSPKNRSSRYPTKYLRAANIKWGGLDLSDVLDMEFHPKERDVYRLKSGDLLLSEASGSSDEVGKPAIWNNELDECCFQNTVIRFRAGDAVLPTFAHVVFTHFARNGVFARVAKGIGIHHLGADRFSEISFPIPPLAEQRRMVAKIEELFSDLDAGVAALERVRAGLKRYRAAVLKAAVEGRLTAEWRRRNPPAEPAGKLLERILAERRKKWEEDQLRKYAESGRTPPKGWKERYKPPVSPACDLPNLPGGWVWATVEQISTKVVDGVHKKPDYVAEGVPFVTVRNLTAGSGISFGKINYVTEADHAEFIKRANPEKGDILVSKDGTLGVIRVIKTNVRFSIFVSVAMVKPVLYECSDYLGLAMSSSVVQQQMVPKGSGLPHIHLEDLREDAVPLASLEEQAHIVAEVQRRLSVVEAVEAEVEHGLKRAARLRQAILKRAFEGRLVPQDRVDELITSSEIKTVGVHFPREFSCEII